MPPLLDRPGAAGYAVESGCASPVRTRATPLAELIASQERAGADERRTTALRAAPGRVIALPYPDCPQAARRASTSDGRARSAIRDPSLRRRAVPSETRRRARLLERGGQGFAQISRPVREAPRREIPHTPRRPRMRSRIDPDRRRHPHPLGTRRSAERGTRLRRRRWQPMPPRTLLRRRCGERSRAVPLVLTLLPGWPKRDVSQLAPKHCARRRLSCQRTSISTPWGAASVPSM